MLHIAHLSVEIENTSIISDLSFSSAAGSFHIIMGPNGSGKSSLLAALIGQARYTLSTGHIFFNNEDITQMTLEKRARLGIFLAFQYPYEIPGVSVLLFMQEAYRALYGIVPPAPEFYKIVEEALALVRLDPSFIHREVNVGFSGGEKKRLELAQIYILKPRLILLDEIDSGLDRDGIICLHEMLAHLRKNSPETSLIMVTHYAHVLDMIIPDGVHIMFHGKLVRSGSIELIQAVQHKGYDAICS